MKSVLVARLGLAAVMAFALSSCTTTQADLRKNPKSISKAALCRTLVENQDPNFRQEIAVELGRRNINPYDCYGMVQQQNQAAAALVAVALVGTAVAVCANNNCGGGSSYYSPPPRYRGNCQYDWQYDAAGNRCGRRSAYSRPGGW
ncbi:hypothetical protein [Ensifer aridi]|uniref:hypothetical protein n=1 Tax=Ensifer aridi TaxID=1708715 RepID=UPI001FCE16C6|nr:hypothetical protein [Ensifer aridi]